MKTKTLSFLALLAFAGAALAGPTVPVRTIGKEEPVLIQQKSNQYFQDQELTLDVFYSYNIAGNIGANGYFATSDHPANDPGDPDIHAPKCVKDPQLTDGSGGGVGVNYFFARYFGVGLEGNWWNGMRGGNTHAEHAEWEEWHRGEPLPAKHKKWVTQLTGNLILRYPMEFDNFGLAPYIFAGGGGFFAADTLSFWDAGFGAEVRLTQSFGIFSDWRYNWVHKGNDIQNFRLGLRFVW